MDPVKRALGIIALIILSGCRSSLSLSTAIPRLTYTNPLEQTSTYKPTCTLTPTQTKSLTQIPTPTITISPTSETNRFFETEGNIHFSYVPPEGWKIVGREDPYMSWMCSCKNSWCHLSFKELGTSVTAKEAADKDIQSLFGTIGMPGNNMVLEILREERCVIEAGYDCHKVEIRSEGIIDHSKEIDHIMSYYIIMRSNVIAVYYERSIDYCKETDEALEQTIFSIREIN